MYLEILSTGILIIFSFIIGFYLGRDRSLKIEERVDKVSNKLNSKLKRDFVVDVDEVALEKKQKTEEKDIIDLKDFPKEYEN